MLVQARLIAAGNADGTIATPTEVVVDADRVGRWGDVYPDYIARSETDKILTALDAPA